MRYTRIAKFTVPNALLHERTEAVRAFMAQFLVLHTEPDFLHDGRLYMVTGECFDEVPVTASEVPRYKLVVNYRLSKVELGLVREPEPESPPCPNCERLKKALEAKNWVTVLDCLAATHA